MNIRNGIYLMILSMLCFSISDAFIKSSAGKMASGPMIFYLGIGGGICFGLGCQLMGQKLFTKAALNRYVMLRNFGEVMGVFGIFTALLIGTLSKVLAIHQMQPIVVTLGAVLFLGERVGWRRWLAIGFAFACVLLIIRPSLSGVETASILAVIGMIGLSIRDLATKLVKDEVSSLQLSFYAYVALIPLGVVLTLIAGESFFIASEHWWRMLAVLIFSMIAYIAITQAVRMAEISILSPFRYSRLIFIFAIGMIFFGERPDWQTYVGSAGIIMAGLFMMMRERPA